MVVDFSQWLQFQQQSKHSNDRLGPGSLPTAEGGPTGRMRGDVYPNLRPSPGALRHPQVGEGRARSYSATPWMALYGREPLIHQLDVQPGERIVEIGCGTGRNFDIIQRNLKGTGEIIGIDSCAQMLRTAEARVRQRGWDNVRLLKLEYGKEPVTRGKADVVLFSYSLSRIPDWKLALACAHSE